jgi:hypothetical protein
VRAAVLRTYDELYVYALPQWVGLERRLLPPTPRGETLSVEASGKTVLVGSEEPPSPLHRVKLRTIPPDPASGVTARYLKRLDPSVAPAGAEGVIAPRWLGMAGSGLLALTAAGLVASRRLETSRTGAGGSSATTLLPPPAPSPAVQANGRATEQAHQLAETTAA